MISRISKPNPDAPIIVIDIGNTSIALATWHGGQLHAPLSVDTNAHADFRKAFDAERETMPDHHVAAVAIASVVPDALDWVVDLVKSKIDRNALIIGASIALPMDLDLTDKNGVGVDRICAAAAAYDAVQASCVVVDFGTAVTVDLVDDEGTFVGGAILPGLHLQIRALHEHTAVLPEVEVAVPTSCCGRNTTEAIQNGVCRGLIGAVRGLVEGYASQLNHWPQVVATGGDLELLAPYCDYLDTQVNHLALRGVGIAYRKHLEAHGV